MLKFSLLFTIAKELQKVWPAYLPFRSIHTEADMSGECTGEHQ